jgi:hypothetical protein
LIMAETGSPLHLAGTALGLGAFVEPEATGIPMANAKPEAEPEHEAEADADMNVPGWVGLDEPEPEAEAGQ